MSSTERAPMTAESAPGAVSGEEQDLLHSSQSAHYHAIPQAIRFPGDLDEDARADVQEKFDAGGFEPTPVQVTVRNRQNRLVEVRSDWDGVQLHLDVCSTSGPVLALRPALAAAGRYYVQHRRRLAALLVAMLVVVGGLAVALVGAL